MTAKTCGCSIESCGCCEGVQKWTPMPTANRPGLPALSYRAGTHGTFFETMKARIASMTVQATGEDGQTVETFQPLTGLTTREASDPAIALLDGWATVGDVLTFYQERIANEGYLRTATERRSVLELARLVGYALRPGVASSVFVAYTMEDKQLDPVEIPIGARSQSIPGPGELPQSFETSEKLIARSVWNNLQVRLKRPQDITLANILSLEKFYVAGASTNLKAGDLLLFAFGSGGLQKAIRVVAATEAEFPDDRTLIRLAPLPPGTTQALPLLDAMIQTLEELKKKQPDPEKSVQAFALTEMKAVRRDTFIGLTVSPLTWAQALSSVYDGTDPDGIVAPFRAALQAAIDQAGKPAPIQITSPDKFVTDLLKEPTPQPRSSVYLARSSKAELAAGSDVHPQLLVNFAPKLKDTFYTAWSNAQVSDAVPVLQSVYALRMSAPLFGAGAARLPSYTTTGNPPVFKVDSPEKWTEWPLEFDERPESLFLDQAYEAIVAGSYAIIDTPDHERGGMKRLILPIQTVSTGQRAAYNTTGKSTRLEFAEQWRPEILDDKHPPNLGNYRTTLVHAQSDALTLVEEPILTAVEGQEIELAILYNELTSGHWVILSGERADIAGVTGVKVSELLMVSGLRNDFNKNLPGDKTHTTLLLSTRTAYTYKRDTLTIYGNVVKATHGETRNETLGSGDGSQSLQEFTLKQPPLTFVPAPVATGVASTLKVYVNDVEWHETDTLAGLGNKDRNFVTKTDDEARTTLIFGNGQEGSRLPTGVLNVKSVYRGGIGKPGNVLAEQISLLQTRPLGVKAVINPLRASGGADKENRDQARENAPLAVMALDRLVSLQDYADFTRTFAGIAKAVARRLSDGHRAMVHLTIAGADDIPIDPVSDLYVNLIGALRNLGDPDLPVQVDSRELVALVLSARVKIASDYQWGPVATEIRAAVLDEFGFQKRGLGQPALLCEVISVIQNIEGVAYVDVDAFGGISEKITDPITGTRRLRTLSELAERAAEILSPSPNTGQQGGLKGLAQELDQTVRAEVAGFENGVLHPAQLAIFSSAVPATLTLNQIL